MNTTEFLIYIGFILCGGLIGSAVGYLLGLDRGFELGVNYDDTEEPEESRRG